VLSGTNQIFIGASNKTTIINGDTIINTTGAGNTTIGNGTGSGFTAIESNGISIGKNLTGAGYIDIGGLSNTTTGYIVVGSPNLHEAFIKAKTVMINHDTTGSVYIGRDNLGRVELRGSIVVLNGQGGDLNLGGVSSGTINLYRPLTVVYSPSALTSLTQIGATTFVTFVNNITNIPFLGQTIATLTIGTAGVYIINYSFRYAGSSTSVANCESWFQTSTNGSIQFGNQAYFSNPNATLGSNVICQSGSAVITATSTSTISFFVFITYTGPAPYLDATFCYYSYTRIA
jgi:hypothetical protein